MKLMISEEQIQKKVTALARRISRDFPMGNVLFIGVLKGAFIFMSDLVRRMPKPMQIDFVRLASYGSGTHSPGTIQLTKDVETSIKGKRVIIVEDIIDTGFTLKYLYSRIKARQPRSLKVVTLLDKPSRRQVGFEPDYVGFKIPDRFVVGYGLDCAEEYRNLRGIYAMAEAVGQRRSAICRNT